MWLNELTQFAAPASTANPIQEGWRAFLLAQFLLIIDPLAPTENH